MLKWLLFDMNLVLLEQKDFVKDGCVILFGRRFEHLKRVNKIVEDDILTCGFLNGKIGTGRVVKVSDQSVEMIICLDRQPPSPLPLTLILALPRPKMLRRIIQNVTTLGVKTIYLINSWRVEKSFWKSPVLTEDSLREQMILGLEQSCDTTLPTIYKKRFFTQFVNEELADISKGAFCMTAHPKAQAVCPVGVTNESVLVVGPEGGFIDIEIDTLKKVGFLPYHAGKRILKVETAVTYLISRLYI